MPANTPPIELLPCPFCGGSATIMSSSGSPHGMPGAGGTRHVECDDCGAETGAGPNRDGAPWNTRHVNADQRLREGGEEVVEKVARAIFNDNKKWDRFSDGHRDAWRTVARAVLRTLEGLIK